VIALLSWRWHFGLTAYFADTDEVVVSGQLLKPSVTYQCLRVHFYTRPHVTIIQLGFLTQSFVDYFHCFLNPHLLEQCRASLSDIHLQQFTKAPPGNLLERIVRGLRLDKEAASVGDKRALRSSNFILGTSA
jgi:hypothetical protein